MADTKTSDETSATALTGAELVRLVQSSTSKKTTAALLGHQNRGCRIERTTNHTAQNFTTETAITWQAASPDTDTFFSAGAPTRATIGSSLGFKVANVSANVRINSITADLWALLTLYHRNSGGTAYRSCSQRVEAGSTTANLSATMLEVPLVDGDYFEAALQVETDTSVDIVASGSSLCVQIIGMEP